MASVCWLTAFAFTFCKQSNWRGSDKTETEMQLEFGKEILACALNVMCTSWTKVESICAQTCSEHPWAVFTATHGDHTHLLENIFSKFL